MDAEDFKSARKGANLSLSQMANLTGYSRSLIASVESGKAPPSTRYTEAFKRALGRGTSLPQGRQDPINLKLASNLVVKSMEANRLNEVIQDAAIKMKQLAKIHSDMIAQVSTIQHQTPSSSTSPVDAIVNIFKSLGIEDLETGDDQAEMFNEYIEKAWRTIQNLPTQ